MRVSLLKKKEINNRDFRVISYTNYFLKFARVLIIGHPNGVSNLLKFSKNVDFKPKTDRRPFKNKFNWRVVRTNKKLNMAIITWYGMEVKPPSGVFFL